MATEAKRLHTKWNYLTTRQESGQRQLYVKGRKLRAATVWRDMLVNRMTVTEAAENWDLPLDAIEEIIRYCEGNEELLSREADEERRRAIEEGSVLSLRILLDEDSQAKALINLLQQAGHDVWTVREASLEAAPDARVLDYARTENRILITRNCDDFRALHNLNPEHAGILAVYEDRVTSKNMSYAEIIRAIANLEASAWDIAGQFIALNGWNY